MKYKVAIFALLAFAPPSLAIQQARNVSRVTVVQPETYGVADGILHNDSISSYIRLKLVKSDAYWYDGRSTYFFYSGVHSLKFVCQYVTVSSDGNKTVTSHQRVVTAALDGGVEYIAALHSPNPQPCNVELEVKNAP